MATRRLSEITHGTPMPTDFVVGVTAGNVDNLFQVSSVSSALTPATADVNFFVATTGSDSNSGTSALTPFRTIGHALLQGTLIDFQNLWRLIVNIADGTYNEQITLPFLTNGIKIPRLIGNVSTPTNCIIDGGGGQDIVGTAHNFSGQIWRITGFTIQNGVNAFRLNATTGQIIYDAITFSGGSTGLTNAIAITGPGTMTAGVATFVLNFTSASSLQTYFLMSAGGQHFDLGCTTHFNSAISFIVSTYKVTTNGFLQVALGGYVGANNVSATRYTIQSGGIIDTSTDRSGVPGNTVGTINTGGLFLPDPIYQLVAPVNAATVTMTPGSHRLIINPAGGLASLTVDLPTNMDNGETVYISTTQTLTSLTVASTDGSTVTAAPTSLTAGTGFAMMYDRTNTTWFISQ